MARLNITQILKATSGKMIQGQSIGIVRRICTNSRDVKKGDLFIALVGKKYDAHTFIPQAVANGANAVIVSRRVHLSSDSVTMIKVRDTTQALGDIARFHRSHFHIPVIAITGSAGKTTTKDMVSLVLRRKYKVLKNIGSENNQFGVPLTILKLKSSHDVAVIEVGTNRPGDISWLASIVQPTIAVITNIGESHLELLKTTKDVFKEKSHLLKFLPANGTVVINRDDSFLAKIPRRRKQRITSVAIHSQATLRARDISVRGHRTHFKIAGQGLFVIQGTAPSNIYNALVAVCCGRLLRVSPIDIKKALSKFAVTPGRHTYSRLGSTTLVDDTYNANPVSFRSALEAIANVKIAGQRILLCGDMLELGKAANRLHCEIGVYAAKVGFDHIVSYGHLSRLIGISAKATNAETEIFHSHQPDEIEQKLKAIIKSGDIVLVKGSRGMHTERFVGFIKQHFYKNGG